MPDTPASNYGLVWDPEVASQPELAGMKEWDGWSSVPTITIPLSTPLYATEQYLSSAPIERVVGGEPFREGYDPYVIVDAQGRYVVIDGHHRAAMHLALGLDDMVVHLLDISAKKSAAAYSDEFIARGIQVLTPDDMTPEEGQRFIDGDVTVRDVLGLLREPAGIWWGLMARHWDIEDIEQYAAPYGLEESLVQWMEEDGTASYAEVGIVLVARRPEWWDPDTNDANLQYARNNPMMGNSFIPEGTRLDLVEVRYNVGDGWRTLPANGISVTASGRTAALSHQMLMGLMEQARAQVDPDDTYDSLCYDTSEVLVGLLKQNGIEADLMEGAFRDPSHAYVVLADGTILDPTLDQFYPGGRGNRHGDWGSGASGFPGAKHPNGSALGPAIISPTDPFADNYLSHRQDASQWTQSENTVWVNGKEPGWWQHRNRRQFQSSKVAISDAWKDQGFTFEVKMNKGGGSVRVHHPEITGQAAGVLVWTTNAVNRFLPKNLQWDLPDKVGMISTLAVNERFQRMGLATEMLRLAREKAARYGYTIVHEDDPNRLSDDGRAWSQVVGSAPIPSVTSRQDAALRPTPTPEGHRNAVQEQTPSVRAISGSLGWPDPPSGVRRHLASAESQVWFKCGSSQEGQQ